jgi:hypothetical protein
MLTADTRPFWTGGAEGQLLIHHCDACGQYFHPPAPVCRACGGRDVSPRPVSGRGVVRAFTINRQAWTPELAEPYIVAIIELADQPGLRLLSNVVGGAPEETEVGMPVQVVFEQQDDVWIPLFEKAA